MYLPYHQLVLKLNDTTHNMTNGIRAKVMDSNRRNVIVRKDCWGTTIRLPTTTRKNKLAGHDIETHSPTI